MAEEANGVGVNLSRLMILRARRAFMNSQRGVNEATTKATPNTGLSELRFVLTHIFRQLRRYSEAEAKARYISHDRFD